jgi:formiminotetrahydrofolate cyclodeaminase
MTSPFLSDLAKAQPNPGGGAAAAHGALLALALLEKVIRLELQRPSQETQPIDRWQERLNQALGLKEQFLLLREADGRAYLEMAEVRAAGETGAGLIAAIREAVAVPLRIIEKAEGALNLVSATGLKCRRHLISDLQVASELLSAAIRGACHIARANLPLVREPVTRESIDQTITRACSRGQATLLRVHQELAARGR